MKFIEDLFKNPYGCTHTHEEQKLLILIIIHSIKLWMDEALDDGDKYSLILTLDEIYYNTLDIICMSHYTIECIINDFM